MPDKVLFRFYDGLWRSINLPSPVVLADFLSQIGLAVPDGCEFCRVNGERQRILYRAYGGTISIQLIPYKDEKNSFRRN